MCHSLIPLTLNTAVDIYVPFALSAKSSLKNILTTFSCVQIHQQPQ
ncbi:hypothetical protein SOHN41_00862 [Shewanella sp. HN-41]|nr:hypothetical protein SOHN41_00862 [Shewanella sp. HN-41]